MSFPVFTSQRFEPFALNELFDFNKYVVKDFIKDCKTVKDVADKVIRAVQYPFYMGQPDDKHHWNHFHGKFDRDITEDYWQTCSETALFLWGDCEDSSVLAVGGIRALDVRVDDVYEVFGLVRDAVTGAILGGHGWVYTRSSSFGTDKYVLVESTLDTPPEKYPEVGSTLDDLKKPFRYGSVVYDPEALFNDEMYIEVRPISLGRKDTRVKHEAIEKSWGIQSKFMKQLRNSRVWRLKRALKLER
jgi:hypothetical protein